MSVSDISDVSDTSNVSDYSSDSENSVTAVLSQDADEDLPSPASVDSLVVSDPDGHSSGDDVDALSPNAEDHSPAVQPRRSAISYLNFMRDFNRRHGGTFRGQKMVNVAAQQWRSMDSDQRNQYRNPDYRQKISKSSYSPESSSTTSLTPSQSDFLASDASSLDEVDCSKKPEPCAKRKRKRKRSCGKKMRKKSACGKRRRKKSACAKKRKASKKSCGKRRRKRRKTC
ncbi:histone-like protein 18C [Drosophila obscura]|uniref:histone-like protein 18C n=1 Tax=Drosophila obscura TaxID=7282 RepID=UPI001BB1B419|nr:histone-like protein 18C [Drosophila obscura]